MFSNRLLRRVVGAGLVLTVAVGPFVAVPVASGDPVGDLQTRAAEVSRQMTSLESEVMANTNAVEAARYQSSQLASQIADAKAKLASARKRELASSRLVSKFALQAYVSGGNGGEFASLLGTAGDKIGQRNGYVTAAVGDRQQLVDDLKASQQVSAEQARALSAAQGQAKAVQDRAEAKQASAQRAADKLRTLKGQLDGQLAEAVAAQQAAAARAAEEQARAQAQAAAARQAQQQVQVQQSRTAATPSITVPQVPQIQSTPATPPADSGGSGGGGFVPPANSSRGAIVVAAAQSQLGVPYVWGGTTPFKGLDCSGLTSYAWAQAGVSLPRVTYGQMNAGQVIPLSQIQPGDLVFYASGGHVAIYVGGGSVIHAPHTGDVVRYASLYMMPPELVIRPG